MSGVADPSEPGKCRYCGGPHAVSAAVAEENPFCSACLNDRVNARPEPSDAEVIWPLNVTLGAARRAFAKRGLHVVGEADKRVLDACSHLDLRVRTDGLVTCYGGLRGVELAEFGRRGEKP